MQSVTKKRCQKIKDWKTLGDQRFRRMPESSNIFAVTKDPRVPSKGCKKKWESERRKEQVKRLKLWRRMMTKDDFINFLIDDFFSTCFMEED